VQDKCGGENAERGIRYRDFICFFLFTDAKEVYNL